jgi:hydrophobic/amphiphilic exporter-1 (mainly G- bacteria), HAE1 family
MVLSTFLNLFFIPVLYVVVKSILVRIASRPRPRPEGCDEEATSEQQQIAASR